MEEAIRLYFESLDILEKNGYKRKPTFNDFMTFRENAAKYIISAKAHSKPITLKGLLKFNKCYERV